MRNATGYAIWQGPDGKREVDTFTCSHCQHIVHVAPRADPAEIGGFCTMCSRHICKMCVGKECVPFEKRLEQMEARYHALRSYREASQQTR